MQSQLTSRPLGLSSLNSNGVSSLNSCNKRGKLCLCRHKFQVQLQAGVKRWNPEARISHTHFLSPSSIIWYHWKLGGKQVHYSMCRPHVCGLAAFAGVWQNLTGDQCCYTGFKYAGKNLHFHPTAITITTRKHSLHCTSPIRNNVLVCNVNLVHDIEIRLITKIIVITLPHNSKVALFYI